MVAVGVFTAPDGGSDDGTQLQGDRQSDLGGDECEHGADGAEHGLIRDNR